MYKRQTILPGTRIGKNCNIFPGAVIGAIPQDMKFKGEYSTVEIGNNNTIREFVTINRGTLAKGKTVIGDNNLLMAYVHIEMCIRDRRSADYGWKFKIFCRSNRTGRNC